MPNTQGLQHSPQTEAIPQGIHMPLTLTMKALPWQAATQSCLWDCRCFELKDEWMHPVPHNHWSAPQSPNQTQGKCFFLNDVHKPLCSRKHESWTSATLHQLQGQGSYFFHPACKGSIGSTECLSPFNHWSYRGFRVVDDTMVDHQLNRNRLTNRRESHKAGEESIIDLLRRHTENL